MAARFLPDAYFSRSVTHRPIFLTLNNVVNHPAATWRSPPGDCSAAARESCRMAKIFDRCPDGERRISVRPPMGFFLPITPRIPTGRRAEDELICETYTVHFTPVEQRVALKFFLKWDYAFSNISFVFYLSVCLWWQRRALRDSRPACTRQLIIPNLFRFPI